MKNRLPILKELLNERIMTTHEESLNRSQLRGLQNQARSVVTSRDQGGLPGGGGIMKTQGDMGDERMSVL